MTDKIVTLAVTGASGAPYFIQLLHNLLASHVKVNLLLSSAAKVVIKTELDLQLPNNESDLKLFFLDYFSDSLGLNKQQDGNSQLNIYGKEEWTSPVASGSSSIGAMVVCPCSMGTLSAIAHGASNNLIERAADVILKERRQLILLTREMPFSSIHLENMLKLSHMGVTIMPASPGFYQQPQTISDLVDFEVADFCKMPFEDESFDVVWAAESVCHTTRKGDFLKEAYRLLRKGGRLVYCDAFMMQREFNESQWQTLMSFFNGWAVPNLCYCDEFEGLLKENNFQTINLDYIHEQTIQSSEYMYKVAKRLHPVQKISQWLGLRSKAQTANFYVGLAQYEIFRNRYAEYCVFTATK